MARAQAEGVPAGAMLSTLQQFDDPHLQSRGFMVPVEQQGSGPLSFEGPAFAATGMAAAAHRAGARCSASTPA